MTTAEVPDGWEDADGTLRRSWTFADFSEAWGFMNRVALLAEAAGHHPDWSNSWNRVTIALTTHHEGNTVTAKDTALAAAINALR